MNKYCLFQQFETVKKVLFSQMFLMFSHGLLIYTNIYMEVEGEREGDREQRGRDR